MPVTIYSTTSCPWCHKTKEFLKANKVKFKDINVGENQKAAQEMIKKSGQQGVPVLDIDGTIIVGFDEAKIKKALKLK
jgi:glutaredoxin 3